MTLKKTCETCDYRKTTRCPIQKFNFETLDQKDVTDKKIKFMCEFIKREDQKMMDITYLIPCSAHSSNGVKQ